MKVLKTLIFILLLLFVGLVIYFGTQDGDVSVSETKEINAPPEVIYDNIRDFKNWENWGSWMEDESLQIDYPEKTSGEGASYSWKSKHDGDGAMQTLKTIPNKKLEQKIVFQGNLVESDGYTVIWELEPDDTGTKTTVTWKMEGTLGLFEKMYFATQDETLEEMIRTMYQESLESLNEVIQKSMQEYSTTVSGVTDFGGGYYLYNTTAAKQSEVAEKTPPMIAQLEKFMADNAIAAQGAPFASYVEWDEENKTAIFSVGIPTKERVILAENNPAISGSMPRVTAVKATLNGHYDYIDEAWEKAEMYIEENNYSKDTSKRPFEVYSTRFPEEKNPAKWVTEIYIPIEEEQAPETE